MATRYLTPGQQLGQISFEEMLDRIGAEVVAELQVQFGQLKLVPSRLASSATHKTYDNRVEVLLNSYYVYVESGRRAAKDKTPPVQLMPPEQAILDWMRRKGIAPGKNNRVVWAIRKAIAKRGIKPRPFLIKAVNRAGANRIAPIFRVEVQQLGQEYAQGVADTLKP